MNRLLLLTRVSFISLLITDALRAADKKVTYDDDLVPIFRNNCLKCHNSDKAKGDLDLSTYGNLMKGAGSGLIVVSGDPLSSRLFRAVTHAEEPNMPPNSPKLADKDLETIKLWIASGLLESAGSKAVVAKMPKVDMTVKVSTKGKPEGPPPMPQDLLLEAVTHTERTSVLTGLAGSPWAPLFAVGGQKQVLLYHSESRELLGILPYPEGFPHDLKFSRNGKLLVAGGGHESKSGQVVLWDATNGSRVMTVGDEFDAVLASDLSADQAHVALGGPGKLVKIYSTKTGEAEFKLKKHTDWVTAMEFSPDGEFLASGDRNGGLIVWETATGQEEFTLTGHKAAITSLSWRLDGEFLATASEDGTVRVWSRNEGKQVNNWNAHNGGVLSVHYSREGNLVTCGRDNRIAVWNGNGKNLRALEFSGDLPVRARFNDDGTRIMATDFAGTVAVWNAADGKRLGEVSANPPPLAERLAEAEKRAEELQATLAKAPATVAQAEADLAAAELKKADKKTLDAAKEKLLQARLGVEQGSARMAAIQASIARLKAAQFNATVWQARGSLAQLEAEHARLLAEAASQKTAAELAAKELAESRKSAVKTRAEKTAWEKKLKLLAETIKSANSKANFANISSERVAKQILSEKTKVDELASQYEHLKAAATSPAAKSARL